MFYVGESITVHSTSDGQGTFECRACGNAQPAVVRGVGEGTSESPYMLGRARADANATRRSHDDAHENLQLTLSLARCPKCGVRDPVAVRRFWTSTAVQLGLVAGAIIGVSAFLGAFDPVGATLWLWLGGIATAVAVPVLYLTRFAWKWSSVDARVAFPLPDQSPSAAPVLARPMTPKPGEQVASRLLLGFGVLALALSGWEMSTIRNNSAPLELACDSQSMASLDSRRWVSVSGCRVAVDELVERWKDDELEEVLIPLYSGDTADAGPVAFVSVRDHRVLGALELDPDDVVLGELRARMQTGPIVGMTGGVSPREADELHAGFSSLNREPLKIEDGRAPSWGLAAFTSLAGVVLLVLGVAKLPRRRWEFEPLPPR